jgi:MoaA/NifB/PqqE/SkfB family radical SAM enzyme
MNREITAFTDMMTEALVRNKRYLLGRPAYIQPFLRISANIKKQEKRRAAFVQQDNLIVPPVLILSVTGACNLSCKGCYACERRDEKEMDIATIRRVVSEAVELGVAVVMLAGGEPLMKEGILRLPESHPDTLFVMFTNGLLLGPRSLPMNLIPVVRLEGGLAATDARRGAGVYAAVKGLMARLNRDKRLFGGSVTLTCENFEEVIGPAFLAALEADGCRAAFLIEYVPTGEDDARLCLTEAQKQRLRDLETEFMRGYNMLIIPLPGNEERYGGCLAAGRGFLHISASGRLEACPFAPYSDTGVIERPLKDALRSRLLAQIRDGHDQLRESRGGCALRENAAWVSALTRPGTAP